MVVTPAGIERLAATGVSVEEAAENLRRLLWLPHLR